MANKDDYNEEELTSLEEMREEELALEDDFDGDSNVSDELKSLFDDASDLELDEDELDDDSLEILADADSNEEEDEDSLSLSELDEEELEASELPEEDEEELSLFSDSPEEESGNLKAAFEKMSAESKELDFSDEEENVLAGEDLDEEALAADGSISEGTELETFDSPEIEEKEFVDADTVVSVVESVLFSTDKAVSVAYIKKAFEGTTVKTDQVRKAIEEIQISYADAKRGVFLEEVSGGYQLRTKVDNMNFLKRIVKGKPFRLSGPALEVLAICAYKQPLIKAEVDEIRGVESGHLMRALMDRSLLRFAGKSELPGKPMLYETTRKFLEIFSLRSLKELPTLSEIDELIPEGIGEEEEKEHLSSVTDNMSVMADSNYSQGEEELAKIEETLGDIDTTTEFFEQEKIREKARQEKERADGIREALEFGEEVSSKDSRWLDRYDKKIEEEALAAEKAKEEALKQEELAASQAGNEDNTLDSDNNDEVNTENSTDESSEIFAESETEPEQVDASEGDESDELFADSDDETEIVEEPQVNPDLSTEAVDNLDAGDESELLFAEEESMDDNKDAKEEALDSAFGNIQNALEAFEGEDGIDIDTEPEMLKPDGDKDPEAEV